MIYKSKWPIMFLFLIVSCAEFSPIHYFESEGFGEKKLLMDPVYINRITLGLLMHSNAPGKVLIVVTIPNLCDLDYPQEILFKIDGELETITDENVHSDCETNLSFSRNETSRSILVGTSLIRKIDSANVTYIKWGPYEGEIDSTSAVKTAIRAFLKKADEKFY